MGARYSFAGGLRRAVPYFAGTDTEATLRTASIVLVALAALALLAPAAFAGEKAKVYELTVGGMK